ncbi:hypothetical protein GLOTRDRAFT_127159 [Gloeophyllum trabeum ATCC 11539]|uniref:Peptidase S33 tripeptidyl aminopeptidase-like C-terminal domain-containing protein n=1 Tax=Gloeophyllum trabeum (strain ATCC 11539 / FP-39264 / Madison 617) TaxID=670483 RepID=S7RZ08_GLOTA|nr:uncharacterized protein GLOTRDRAFT_127159 [Gloeophyllum trabeum ATCC 11539]EPQ58669.1 hypothetical protein GLOTRDRAFT_127159 [Gloeophyllum trabeum ATCC 11539]
MASCDPGVAVTAPQTECHAESHCHTFRAYIKGICNHAEQLAQALEQNSPQVVQGPMELEFFAYVPDVQPRQSRYDGPFGLANGTLHTPKLITHDPVTAYKNALSSLKRLGDNARLVQQADGYGHTSLSQVSFCVWEQV